LAGDSNRFADVKNRVHAKRSPKTVKQALGVLRRICNVAVLDGAISANPAAVKLTTSSKRRANGFHHLPLTPAQIAALADHVSNEQGCPLYALALTFCAYSGLRAADLGRSRDSRSDALGSSWAPLALSESNAPSGTCEKVLSQNRPKTDESLRTVPLEAWLADDLRDYLSAHGNGDDPTAPLFPGLLNLAAAKAHGRNVKDSADRFDWSKRLDPSNVYKRFMAPALVALGLPSARFHDLRHSFAVNLLSASPPVDFKRVSKWLGHSTFSLTLDVYDDYINDDVSQPAGLARPIAVASNVLPLNRRNG
jgi:integrase